MRRLCFFTSWSLKGRAGGSYGLLQLWQAGLEKDLLRVARRKSQQLKQGTLEKPTNDFRNALF